MAKKKINPKERFKRWHWGKAPTHQIKIDDPRFPDEMIEIGRLMELRFNRPEEVKNNPKKVKETPMSIELDEQSVNECYVVFDHNHPKDRIYFILNENAMQDLMDIYEELDDEPVDMNELASKVGGHHSKMNDYPNTLVKPLGYLSDLVYYTHKVGDDDGVGSGYIHKMGEEKGGVEPIIAVSEDGNLWLLGGSYYCPVAGITN